MHTRLGLAPTDNRAVHSQRGIIGLMSIIEINLLIDNNPINTLIPIIDNIYLGFFVIGLSNKQINGVHLNLLAN